MKLYIDPGIRGCGAALFTDLGVLSKATYVKNPVLSGNDFTACVSMARAIVDWITVCGVSIPGVSGKHSLAEIGIEYPQIYKVTRGDNNDLLPLVAVGAALCGIVWERWSYTHGRQHDGPKVVQCHPHDWKGSADADVMIRRILDRLSSDEEDNLDRVPKAISHNMIDAVGVGLYFNNRLNPIRSYSVVEKP